MRCPSPSRIRRDWITPEQLLNWKKKNSDSKTVTCFYLYIFLVFSFSLYVSLALHGHLFFPLILNGLKINSEHKDLGLQYLSFESKCINVQGFVFFYV